MNIIVHCLTFSDRHFLPTPAAKLAPQGYTALHSHCTPFTKIINFSKEAPAPQVAVDALPAGQPATVVPTPAAKDAPSEDSDDAATAPPPPTKPTTKPATKPPTKPRKPKATKQ